MTGVPGADALALPVMPQSKIELEHVTPLVVLETPFLSSLAYRLRKTVMLPLSFLYECLN